MEFIDISTWNGKFDWNKAKSQSVDGVYIKASQANFIDSRFKENSASCSLSYKGAYHFFDYRSPGADQAKFFLDTVGSWNNLKGALDLEDNSGSGWPKLSSMYGLALQRALEFVTEYYKETGHYPVLYISSFLTTLRDTLGRYVFRNFHQCPLWVAHYTTATTPTVKGWGGYALWQYTSTAPGILHGNSTGNPYIDKNVIYDLNTLLIKAPVTNEDEVITDSEKLNRLWNAHPELY
jgi:GH25 family lysozyme M1 (1,4-beta-N-acetylmuramidase)